MTLEDILAAALAGGAEMIQLRDKTLPSGTLLPLAQRLRARCRAARVPFIVNDRVDLAVAVDADGVHLGQDDLPPAAARALMKPGKILGLSTHSEAQAAAAQAAGADYVAVGSMFPTDDQARVPARRARAGAPGPSARARALDRHRRDHAGQRRPGDRRGLRRRRGDLGGRRGGGSRGRRPAFHGRDRCRTARQIPVMRTIRTAQATPYAGT